MATRGRPRKDDVREEEPKRKADGSIDYSDVRNQIDLINDLIANGDEGQKLDAMKILIQLQKASPDTKTDEQIHRFYTPLRCSECPFKGRKGSYAKREKWEDDLLDSVLGVMDNDVRVAVMSGRFDVELKDNFISIELR